MCQTTYLAPLLARLDVEAAVREDAVSSDADDGENLRDTRSDADSDDEDDAFVDDTEQEWGLPWRLFLILGLGYMLSISILVVSNDFASARRLRRMSHATSQQVQLLYPMHRLTNNTSDHDVPDWMGDVQPWLGDDDDDLVHDDATHDSTRTDEEVLPMDATRTIATLV